MTRFELVAVVAFAGTVGLGASLFLGSERSDEQLREAITDARRILSAAEQWRFDNDDGCPTVTQLVVDRRLERDARADDPWGNRYRIHCEAGGVAVRSPGKDGKLGTSDDVRVGEGRSDTMTSTRNHASSGSS